MGRKERSAEEQARRAKIRELLEVSQVSSMEDVQNLFKETIAEFMEDGLDVELTEELGYSKLCFFIIHCSVWIFIRQPMQSNIRIH